MTTDGGHLVARALARAGVANIFALHGGHIDPIIQACHDTGIRIIDTRHEQAAGHMADAWARLTGRPGVAVVTAGPGVTDIITAVANAHLDAVPMVVIGGRHPLADDEMMPLQELHGVPLMQSITKWTRLVRDPRRIGEYVSAALHQATSGRPGPVFLEIPADVLARPIAEDEVPVAPAFEAPSRPRPSAEAVESALAMLAGAERPLIMAGRGAWFAGAADDLRAFAELTSTPVIANGMARGAVPEDTQLGLGGFLGAGNAVSLGAPPDVVLMLGARHGLFTGGRRSIIPDSARLIQVDIQAEELTRGERADLPIAADARETLRALSEEARKRDWPDRSAWLQAANGAAAAGRAMLAGNLDTSRPVIHPYLLASEVTKAVEERGTISVDGGDTWVWTELALKARRPGRYLGHGYLGCLGIGLPFALAAKLAHPDEPSVLITGDGSVGLNFAEFDTAVRHNLAVTVIVNNDQAWGMCKHEQMVRFGSDRIIATELGTVHYEKAAEAFGVHAEFVESAEGIAPAIERAMAAGKPSCVNVMTDPDAISPAQAAMAAAGPGYGQ
jgi:acetolactate synthase-1/2/3 large subunit